MFFVFLAELPVLNQEQENVTASSISSKTLTRAQFAKQLLHSKENTVKTTVSKKDTFVLEDIDSTYEKFENTHIKTVSIRCVPIKNHSQLITSDNDMSTEGTTKEDILEKNKNTGLRRTIHQNSIKDTFEIIPASPILKRTVSRQSQRQVSKLARIVKQYQVGRYLRQVFISIFIAPLHKVSLCFFCFIIDCSNYDPSEKMNGLKVR